MAFIEFEHVNKIYGTGEAALYALSDMNLEIEQGELCVIVGPSGAGKTTLLNILGGMDTPTSGTVRIDGRKISGLDDRKLTAYRRNEVGFVFQFYNLMQNLTARENVELAAEMSGSGISPDEVLRAVGLEGRSDHFPAQLSGGEQQRVSIARALVKDPKIILCDEPTGALDYRTGKMILKLLAVMCREAGKTVIIITHNQAITQIADRVIRIRNGQEEAAELNASPKAAEEIEW